MGGPRGSTIRNREGGIICSNCHRFLPEPITPTPKLCSECGPQYRVLMCFELNRGTWHVTFRKFQAPRPLPRVVRFGDADKLWNLYRRFGSSRMSEDVQAFDFAIGQGKGIVELSLGQEQWDALQTKAPSSGRGLGMHEAEIDLALHFTNCKVVLGHGYRHPQASGRGCHRVQRGS